MLAYRIPREPSTPRIAVWRRLKRLGVAQIGDGLVGLPYDSATKESLEWVAAMIEEADGQATIWIATPTIRRYGRDLAQQLCEQRALEYQAIVERAAESDGSKRSVKALRSELRRVERRDHFPPSERADARAALERLEERVSA